MVTKTTAKKTTRATTARAKKPVVKKAAPKKRPAARSTAPDRVDYYPNRMTVAVSALAGTILVLVAVIAVLGTKS